MKHSFFLFILLTTLTISSHGQAGDFKKLEWLTGTWNRTNIKPGRTAHERWEKITDDKLRGYGVTIQGSDTVFLEKMTLLIKDNAIYYVADVPENQQPVYFKLTSVTSTGFVCENPQHDFPKKISYQLDGANLKAQISGDGKSMDFLFRKQ